MPLFGHTGSVYPPLLTAMQQALFHRGATCKCENVGGHHTEVTNRIQVAWSGQIRSNESGKSLSRSFAEEGISFLNSISGEFVVAIYQNEELFLARDPAGARTAYFGKLGSRWVVSAEPKGIWQLPNFQPRLRHAAVAEYFTYSFIPGIQTMLEDLWEIPPGHYVRLREGQPFQLERYFDFPIDEFDAEGPLGAWPQRFKQLMEETVAQRLANIEQPTIFLSGGLDSSIVTAELAEQWRRNQSSAKPIKTYSIHFGKDYPNELEYARSVSQRFRTDHEEFEIPSNKVADQLQEMVWALDEPIGDPVTAPNFLLAQHAAEPPTSRPPTRPTPQTPI